MNKIIYLGLSIMLLFLIMPFAQASAADIVQQKYPGVYIVDESTLSHDPYDPATNYETLGGQLIQEVYEGLIDYNGSSTTSYRMVLATGYTVSPDGLNYTFDIRQNVNFTDALGNYWGTVNAYVFQYSIQRAILMNDPSSGIWILDQSVRGGDIYGGYKNANITEAQAFLNNMSVVANSPTSLSIYLQAPSAAFLPELIFPTSYAVSPSWIIANEPSSYTTNGDNQTGMISLQDMFPSLSAAQIRTELGLSSTADVANSGIVPQSAHDDPVVGYTALSTAMVGTGPYMLKSEVPGVSISLERNDNWWNKANFHKDASGTVDAPKQVLLKVVPETETRVLDIKNSEAHQAYLPLANLGEIMNSTTHQPYIDNVNVFTYPSLNTAILGFNENDTVSAQGQLSASASSTYTAASIQSNNILKYSWRDVNGSLQYASPDNPFSAFQFREAFAYAFDYNTYLNTILGGQYFRLNGVIPKGLLGHQGDLVQKGYIPTQDLSTAKALFQKVGWQGTVTVNYNSGNVERQKSAELLAQTIQSLGVGITVKTQEVQWSQFLTLNYGGQAALFFLGWAPDYADASDYAVPFLHTNGLFPESMHYSNPHVDALMDQANAMTGNDTGRNTLYRQMEINASGDYPYIYLAQQQNVMVRSLYVKDWASTNAGNENPMSSGTRYQYVGLGNFTPSTNTTTPEIAPSVVPSSSAGSSATNSANSATPGFEMIAVVGLLSAGALATIKKRRN